MSATHQCPAPACTVQVSEAMFACRSHWFALPRATRSAITAAYVASDREALRAEQAEAIRLFVRAATA